MVQVMEADAQLMTAIVDAEIVEEVITGITAMTITTGEISSLVESR